LNLNNNNLKDDTIGIKNDKKYNNISKIIHNNNESKPYFGKSKDDFYYDLYAEKIIDIEKVNNSYEEIHLLQKLKEKYNNKFDKFLQMKPNKTIKSKIRKSVKFMESETRIIKINQKDIASKFEVYNVSGKKIFYQKCNINNYMKKLKDKNLKKKSILINKKEEFVDNSEWDKLYDIINKIAKKSDNKAFNTDNKKKFNIKNIESFKKKGKKILVKNNKSKK
jgi:MFS superfamily sulfate permease-like transporter